MAAANERWSREANSRWKFTTSSSANSCSTLFLLAALALSTPARPTYHKQSAGAMACNTGSGGSGGSERGKFSGMPNSSMLNKPNDEKLATAMENSSLARCPAILPHAPD